MIYSRMVEHAIRGLVHLSRAPSGKIVSARDIAEQENLPCHVLAKVLQQFGNRGLLRTLKGPQGRFALRADPRQIRILDIVEIVDGPGLYQECPSGFPECSDDVPCLMHDSWVSLRKQIMNYLEANTVADLARALETKTQALNKK